MAVVCCWWSPVPLCQLWRVKPAWESHPECKYICSSKSRAYTHYICPEVLLLLCLGHKGPLGCDTVCYSFQRESVWSHFLPLLHLALLHLYDLVSSDYTKHVCAIFFLLPCLLSVITSSSWLLTVQNSTAIFGFLFWFCSLWCLAQKACQQQRLWVPLETLFLHNTWQIISVRVKGQMASLVQSCMTLGVGGLVYLHKALLPSVQVVAPSLTSCLPLSTRLGLQSYSLSTAYLVRRFMLKCLI